MSKLLNKNHPFRQSITHDSATIAASNTSTNQSGESATGTNSPDSKSKLPPLSLKTKIILFSTVGGIVAYGWSEIYDSIYPEQSMASAKKTSEHSQASDYGSDVEEDWSYQPEARRQQVGTSQVSWLSRTFCRGGKRARFCD